MNTKRIVASLAAGAALLTITPLAANAATPVKAWGQGSLKAGSPVDIYAQCKGTSGKVTGPAGMSAKLTPMASRGHLGAQLTVPRGFKGTVATFTVTCSDGAQGKVVLKASARLAEDGKLGPKTIAALQRYVGVKQTGRLDRTTVKAIQVKFGREAYGQSNRVKVDGILGKQTIKAIQTAIGSDFTGAKHFDRRTTLALQATLNRVNGY